MIKHLFIFIAILSMIAIKGQESPYFSTDSIRVTHRDHPTQMDSVITKIDVKFIYYTAFYGPKTVEMDVTILDNSTNNIIRRTNKETVTLNNNTSFYKYSKEVTLGKNQQYYMYANIANVYSVSEGLSDGKYQFYTLVGFKKIAEYNFNNTHEGQMSGNGTFVKADDSYVQDRFGNINSARNGNSTSLLNLDANFNLPTNFKPRTYSMWIKKSSLNPAGNILFKITDTNSSNFKEISASISPSYYFTQMKGADNIVSNLIHQQNVWYHYVITFDGFNHKTYRNGLLIQNTNYKLLNIANNSAFHIGEGNYDDIQIYEGVMEPEDVYSLYQEQSQNAILNTENVSKYNKIIIAQNPDLKSITIIGNAFKKGQLINVNGQVVKEFTKNILDISDLANGLYFLKFELKNGEITTSKFIKK